MFPWDFHLNVTLYRSATETNQGVNQGLCCGGQWDMHISVRGEHNKSASYSISTVLSDFGTRSLLMCVCSHYRMYYSST